jgi:hypothetical protein
MAGERYQQGLLDTNILILGKWIDPAELPAAVAISAITLGELSAGPREVRPNSEQREYEEHAERARRLDVLQRSRRWPSLKAFPCSRPTRLTSRGGTTCSPWYP